MSPVTASDTVWACTLPSLRRTCDKYDHSTRPNIENVRYTMCSFGKTHIQHFCSHTPANIPKSLNSSISEGFCTSDKQRSAHNHCTWQNQSAAFCADGPLGSVFELYAINCSSKRLPMVCSRHFKNHRLIKSRFESRVLERARSLNTHCKKFTVLTILHDKTILPKLDWNVFVYNYSVNYLL